jgi:hypothetical protein
MKDHLIKIMNFTERALLSSQLDHTKVVSWMESRKGLEFTSLLIIFDMRDSTKMA